METPDSVMELVEVLSERGDRPIVVVDFVDFSSGPSLTSLVRPLASSRTVYRIDAVGAFSAMPARSSFVDLANACSQELRGLGVPAELIVGYCSSASLALHIANTLASSPGGRPTLILVQPAWVDRGLVADGIADIRSSLGAASWIPGTDTEPVDLAAVLDLLRPDVLRKLTTENYAPEELDICMDMMLDNYGDWIGFLLAAESASIPAPDIPVRYFLSADTSPVVPAHWPAELVTSEIFDLAVGDMLSSSAVLSRLA